MGVLNMMEINPCHCNCRELACRFAADVCSSHTNNSLLQVSWFHNTTFITYSGPRPGVSMITDKSPSSVLVTLIISAAETEDTGTYFCRQDIRIKLLLNKQEVQSSLTK